jgi:hypothetical protein
MESLLRGVLFNLRVQSLPRAYRLAGDWSFAFIVVLHGRLLGPVKRSLRLVGRTIYGHWTPAAPGEHEMEIAHISPWALRMSLPRT